MCLNPRPMPKMAGRGDSRPRSIIHIAAIDTGRTRDADTDGVIAARAVETGESACCQEPVGPGHADIDAIRPTEVHHDE